MSKRSGFFFFILVVLAVGAAAWFFFHLSQSRQTETNIEDFHPASKILFSAVFNDAAMLKTWGERVFEGHTTYEIVDDKGEKVLRAYSKSTSSALYQKIRAPIAAHPQLIWEWKATKYPKGKKNETFAARVDNDYAGRVYAVFDSDIPLIHDIIQYVWDDHFKPGTYATSPSMKTVRIMVVENGPASTPDGYAVEKRDLYEDYKLLYGREPKKDLVVIGLTTDADNTETESEVLFRRMSLELPSEAEAVLNASHENLVTRSKKMVAGATKTVKDTVKDVVFFWKRLKF